MLLAAAALVTMSLGAGASPVAATSSTCVSSDSVIPIYLTGRYSSTQRTGVRAEIDPSDSAFGLCTGGTSTVDGGQTSAWVGFFNNPADTGIFGLIELGVVRCNEGGLPCNGSATLHYVYQILTSCDFNEIQDLGSAGSFGAKVYRIDYTGGHLVGFIDKDGSAGPDGYTQVFDLTVATHNNLSCWFGGEHLAFFGGERNDAGDSLGSSSFPTTFTDMKTLESGTWSLFGTSTTTCTNQDSGSTCQFTGDGDMKIYDS
jgi:hypothetical protein